MKEMLENNITYEKAKLTDLNEILSMYKERSQWFKEKGIDQWRKYLINHPKEEFVDAIKKGNYYILKKENQIIAGFEISTYSSFWNDSLSKAYYIYKIVVKVGNKNIGKYIFNIAKTIAKENKKEYLRLECKTSNKKLNDIYMKHGFEFIRSGQDYYDYTLREYKINEKKL